MVKLRILSDLHLEIQPWDFRPAGEDLVILAGDICDCSRVGRHHRKTLFDQIRNAGLQALYIIGNHEGYRLGLPHRLVITAIREGLPNHVTLLDRSTVVDRFGLRFIGCTLWTDFRWVEEAKFHRRPLDTASAITFAEESISDFHHWLPDGAQRRLCGDDLVQWHREKRAWLDQAIGQADRPVVVVTHFLPGPESVAPQFRSHPLTPYFVSDCRDLMRSPVRLWIHGHTHTSCRYRHRGVEVVCNPRGYGDENAQFKGDLIVEVTLPDAP